MDSLFLTFARRDKSQEKEIKCQKGLYPIDQLDSSGLDVPPSVSDCFADGNRVRCNAKGAFPFFSRRGKARNRGRSFGGLCRLWSR
jgi:hypothetical protein